MVRTASDIVYILQCGGLYKIGVTTDIKRRMKQIQKTCTTTLSCVWSIDKDNAIECEKMIHKAYKHVRPYGEWFRLSEKDIADIKAACEGFVSDTPTAEVTAISLRIPTALHDQIKAICHTEDRSVHTQIVRFLRESVVAYEPGR